jgi:transposase-like protein
MESPKTLQQAIQYFSDEQVCIDAVAAMRWLGGPRCPDCHGDDAKNPYYLKTQKRWKCRSCRRQFSVKVNTIFEDSPIPLQKWLPALWLLISCKNGVSSWEIHRTLGITQKSAWFMLQRIRLALQAGSTVKLGGSGSEVEVDETFIGGKARNMHATSARRRRLNQAGVTGKTPIVGLLERGGEVRAAVVPTRRKHDLQGHIREHVEAGGAVYTDALMSYQGLEHRGYMHKVIDHAERYVDGRVHTNGLENFWSLLKRGLKGTYVSVEPFHLFRYLDEQAWRYNNRATLDNPKNDGERFSLAVSQIVGKRLTYAEVTGKAGELEKRERF